ncbi:MAG: serine/threonine protein kinase, partial [Lentisphaerae bacterium]|nr:serine/threonine protein kinase [Lentisphaerota bacterium]
MPNPKIPGFEIIERMPQGGMSAVFKARQVSLDRLVALKTLPPHLASDAEDVNRFLTEARTIARLKHPNIVQVYDFGESDRTYFFVMEFISGYSVSNWLKRRQKLSEDDALLVARSVAEALEYAWDKAGII